MTESETCRDVGEIESASTMMQRISELCVCADNDAHKVLWPITTLDEIEQRDAAIRARAFVQHCHHQLR